MFPVKASSNGLIGNDCLSQLLKAGCKTQVVVAEGAPDFGGHKLAKALAAAGISTTAIPDSATFAMMARVNKVILSFLCSYWLWDRDAHFLDMIQSTSNTINKKQSKPGS